MEPNTSSSVSSQEPQPGDFSPPKCWCESTGHYTNPAGQEFNLRVRGGNPDTVLDYLKAVRVAFEVIPLSKATPEETEPPKEGPEQKTEGFTEEQFNDTKRNAELDLEIAMEVVETQGIELPYVLRCTIDPYIAQGAGRRYVTSAAVSSVSMNVTASQGGVNTGLFRGYQWITGGQADTIPTTTASQSVYLWGAANPVTQFYLMVIGLLQANYYVINSSATFV